MPKAEGNGTSARRALRVLKALKGQALNGVSNAELARSLNETPVNITRSLDALMAEGLVTKLDSGRFAHSVFMLQVAVAFAQETERASSRIAELNQRVHAGARG